MKVMVKPKKMLLHLFEKEGYERDSEPDYYGFSAKDSTLPTFFNDEMFAFAGKEIDVVKGQEFEFTGRKWTWRKEWLVPKSLREAEE